MQLVERHIIKNSKAIEELCFKCARLYNFCNYYKRQVYFGKMEKFREYELSKLLSEFDQEDYRALSAQSSQQVIKLLFKNWKGYFCAMKQYAKNPSLFNGKPKPPKYKDKKGYSICIFTNQDIRHKGEYIYFPNKFNLEPLKTKVENIAQVRIVPQANCFVIEVIYESKIQIKYDLDKTKFLSIDLGLNNLATSINNVGIQPFIINGKVLKSVNQMYNKTKAKLMSYVGSRGTSNRIGQLTFYRNNFIEDKLHKISRYIVNYCIENKIGTIIIGRNKGWKDNINIGKANNQKFQCLPHARLFDKIKYKAQLAGIDILDPEESYSSKTDHLAYEEMKYQEVYLGRRVKRGLFQSSIRKLINADINGAIGIARKVFDDSVVKQIINSGLAFNPVRLNII